MAENKLALIRNSLHANQKQITAKLGGMIKPEYFCSAFLTMVEKNPMLADCTEASLVRAVLDAAQLRLITDGVMGEAYIVPYGRTAQMIVGYKGLIQLCLRSGLVKKIGARIVYENDFFEYEYGMNEACKHIPTEGDPGNIRGAYGTFEMSDGVKGFEFWPYTRLMLHKEKFAKGLDKKDKNGKYTSPWRTNEEAMIFKTVIRSITKLLPKSIEELQKADQIEKRINPELEEAIDIELSKKEIKQSKQNLDAEKNEIQNAIVDDVAVEDDIPIADAPPTPEPEEKGEFFTVDEQTAFNDRVRELKIPSSRLVKFLKDNGWKDTAKIPRWKYTVAMQVLDNIAKEK